MNELQIAEVQALRDDLARTKEVIANLIAWLATNRLSPEEASRLYKQLART